MMTPEGARLLTFVLKNQKALLRPAEINRIPPCQARLARKTALSLQLYFLGWADIERITFE